MADQDQPGGCTIEILELPGVLCPGTAVTAALLGCVHEHIDYHLLCSGHVREGRDGSVVCGRCLEAGHEVAKLLVLELPLTLS